MIPLYQPGTSLLHRLPAALKLLVLTCCGIAAVIWRDHWQLVVVLAGIVLTGYTGLGWRARPVHQLLHRIWALRWLALFLLVSQLIFLSADQAALNTARILSVILLAALFSLSTSPYQVLQVMVGLLLPVQRILPARWGFRAESIGVVMAQSMAAVPVVFQIYRTLDEARRARGLRRTPAQLARMMTPLLIQSLRHAQQQAEVLWMRNS